MKKIIFANILSILSFTVFSQSGWVAQNTPVTNNFEYINFIDINTGFAGAPFLKTTDSGQNWILNSSAPAFYHVSFPNANTGYGAAGSVFKTTNGGSNWFNLGGIGKRIVKFISPDSGMAAGEHQPGGLNGYLVFYKTTTGGNTWDSLLFGFSLPGSMISESFTSLYIYNPNNAYLIQYNEDDIENTLSRVWKSVDFGNNWSAVHSSDTMVYQSIMYTSLDTGYCIGDESTLSSLSPWMHYVYKIINNNYTPVFSTNNENLYLNSLYFINNSTGFVSGSSGLIFKTTNGGMNWVQQNSGTGHDLNSIYFINSLTGFISGNNGTILKTTTGGETFNYSISGKVLFQDNLQPVSSGKVKAIKYDYQLKQMIVVDSAIIQSNGDYILPHIPHDSIDIMAFQDDEETAVYVPTYYVSTIYWQNAATLFPESNLTGIDIRVFRTFSAGGPMSISGYVYTSANNDSYSFLKDAVLYARSGPNYKEYSVSLSNGSYCIDSLTNGTYEITVDRMGFYPVTQFATINGSNILNFNFNLMVFLKVIPSGNQIPLNYTLSQNYPNPFNPSTIIRFNVPVTGYTTLKVCDLLGRELKTLINETLKPGYYEAEWDGSNYSSGVYFYKIISGDYIETKKMVLAK